MNLVQELARKAGEQPTRPFVRTERESWTYEQFYRAVRRFAGYMELNYHIRPGDRVMLCFGNEIDYFIAYFACWHVGATAMPVDVDSRDHTLKRMGADARPALFLHSALRDKTEWADVPCAAFPSAEAVQSAPEAEGAAFPAGRPALILYTSGTTGDAKGVMISHDQLLFTARRIIEWADMRPTDRELTTLRLTHSFGLGHIHCYILLGAEIVLLDSSRDAARLFRFVRQYRVTGMPATPALIRLWMRYHKEDFQRSCRNLSYIVINTAPIEPELAEELLRLLPNTGVYMYYGLTEASRSTYIAYRQHRDKLASVGRPPAGVNVRLDGTSREVQIRGDNVMMGYLHHDDSFLEDGWLATGDIGRMDEEGFLYITGRLKEQVNIDGLKVNPGEVEKVIARHEAVRECVVFGVADELTHEKLVAAVVCRDGYTLTPGIIGEIKRMCKPELELYKIPREFRQWPRVPRTDSGKPRRSEAKAWWEGGFHE